MLAKINEWRLRVWDWCKRSQTIVWARLQVLAGAVWSVLIVTDLSALLGPKSLAAWLIVSGFVTEYMRRIKGETTL